MNLTLYSRKIIVSGIPVLALAGLTSCGPEKASPPNIIYILADDLGYGDLSCYGQEKYRTPHIDRLAAEGMRFTQHYAGSTVSAPSRSVLLTGLHTGHTPIRGNGSWQPEGQVPLPAGTPTFTRLLDGHGYTCGAFGKWALGFADNEGSPLNHGFRKFYGYYCQSLAHRYYPDYLWDNETKIDLENDGTRTVEYAADLIHNAALEFIKENRDRRFFLYLPYTIPHAELIVPEDSVLISFRNRFLPEKEYRGRDYGPDFTPGGYCSQAESHAVFAAMVTRLDRYVGEILDRLETLGLDRHTLVMFSSDNGPHLEGGADPDYFDSNGPLRGYKRDLYEGGIRVPFLARWPGKIREGTVSTHTSSFWDLFPTICELAGMETPGGLDGISFLPALMGKEQQEHDFLYWEFYEQNGRQAVRTGPWKGVRLGMHEKADSTLLLFNLDDDPGESTDLAADFPHLADSLARIMVKAHTPSDRWQYGAVKQ